VAPELVAAAGSFRGDVDESIGRLEPTCELEAELSGFFFLLSSSAAYLLRDLRKTDIIQRIIKILYYLFINLFI
jgi:hypothetical protein